MVFLDRPTVMFSPNSVPPGRNNLGKPLKSSRDSCESNVTTRPYEKIELYASVSLAR